MILAGIRPRSALLKLWVLIEPRVELDFPSAAQGDIFSQTVALVLRVLYSKTTQKVHFLLFSRGYNGFGYMADPHSQADSRANNGTACNGGGRCFHFLSPSFAREGGVRNRSRWGGGVSIPAGPARSRGRMKRERARVEVWVLRWRRCRGVWRVKSMK